MNVYLALLRGINVGGHNKLAMADFRSLLRELGCAEVSTYIQSGNAVFRHRAPADEIASKIEAAIDKHFGFRPTVQVLDRDEVATIAAANPFDPSMAEANRIHISFLAQQPAVNAEEMLRQKQAGSERFHLADNALYLLAPDGIARSRLARDAERCLGASATGRNLKTVDKLLQLLRELA